MSIRLRSLALAAVVAAPFVSASAQRVEKTADFKWSDQIASGRWVNVHNINGRVTVGQASGDRVEVTAIKRWTRGNPDDVRIEAKKDGEDVVVCALWGGQTSCDDQNNRRGRSRWDDNYNNDDDISVDFTLLIPRGVKIGAASVNGGVVVSGVTADAELSSVNGDIRVETGAGPLTASTVNGNVHAKIMGESATTPLSFSTVNGSVFAELPPSFGADVTMTTVNGTLNSDYAMTVSGRIDPHHLSVHVGAAGGPRITLTTVNGSVELRKR
jgi:hypothetical protein